MFRIEGDILHERDLDLYLTMIYYISVRYMLGRADRIDFVLLEEGKYCTVRANLVGIGSTNFSVDKFYPSILSIYRDMQINKIIHEK